MSEHSKQSGEAPHAMGRNLHLVHRLSLTPEAPAPEGPGYTAPIFYTLPRSAEPEPAREEERGYRGPIFIPLTRAGDSTSEEPPAAG